MIKLHGVEVKVGDRVWSLNHGWIEVTRIDEEGPWPIVIANMWAYNGNGIFQYSNAKEYPGIYWQEISPEAIEAAKQKPKEEVFEWQWLVKARYSNNYFFTTEHYKSEYEMRVRCDAKDNHATRIEESKRLVSHE